MRLLAGLVAGLEWETELVGDESLSARPMDRVAEPLGLMGATVVGHGERCLPPLRIGGGALHGIDWTSRVASAQVKSAIILAGLSASGTTVVREAVTTRTHTEEMLAEAGADITVEPWGDGRIVTVRASRLEPVDRTVPGDPSASAFFVVAGCVVPGSTVDVAGVYSGPARLGYVPVLQRMGADVTLLPGVPGTVTIRATAGPLHATEVGASEIPSLDEIPALAVAAAVAQGRADWGVAIETVARQYGLGFLPLQVEHYDFMIPKKRAERPPVRRFVSLLAEPEVREQLSQLGFELKKI